MAVASVVGPLLSKNITLTSAQIKALRATPILYIEAPASGYMIMPGAIQCLFTYGGTSAFTNPQVIKFTWDGVSTASAGPTILATSLLSGTATGYAVANTGTTAPNFSVYSAKAIYLQNTGASEITGNAENNNTLTIQCQYYIVPIPQ